MADSLIRNLTEKTAPEPTDITIITSDPGGTPVDRKTTLDNQLATPHTRSVYTETTSPATPDAGKVVVYALSDGELYKKDATGTEVLVSTGSAMSNALAECRITPVSGTPVQTADATTVSTLYLTPYNGDRLSLYDGTKWSTRILSETSVKLYDTSKAANTTNGSAVLTNITDTSQLIPGMLVSGLGIQASSRIASVDSTSQITLDKTATADGTAIPLTIKAQPVTTYDIWAYDDSGTPKLEISKWMEITATNNPAAGSNVVINISNTSGLAVYDTVGIENGDGTAEFATITAIVANTSITVYTLANSYTTPIIHLPLRTADLEVQDNIKVKSGDATRRYMGVVMTTTTAGYTESTIRYRRIQSYYNQVEMELFACPGYVDDDASTEYSISISTVEITGSTLAWVNGTIKSEAKITAVVMGKSGSSAGSLLYAQIGPALNKTGIYAIMISDTQSRYGNGTLVFQTHGIGARNCSLYGKSYLSNGVFRADTASTAFGADVDTYTTCIFGLVWC